jgi:glutaredoxin 3
MAWHDGTLCPPTKQLHYGPEAGEAARQGGPDVPRITIYTTFMCPYCHAAKELLEKKGAPFEEIDVSYNPTLREEVGRKAGGRTSVPQIWIGDTHVGGCDELHELDSAGRLDPLLQRV